MTMTMTMISSLPQLLPGSGCIYKNVLRTQPLPVFVRKESFLNPTHNIMFEHVLNMIPRVLGEKINLKASFFVPSAKVVDRPTQLFYTFGYLFV